MASVSRGWVGTQCSRVCRRMSPIHLIHKGADMNEIKCETTTQLANERFLRRNIGADRMSRSSPAKVRRDHFFGDTSPRQLQRLSKLTTIGIFEQQALNDIKDLGFTLTRCHDCLYADRSVRHGRRLILQTARRYSTTQEPQTFPILYHAVDSRIVQHNLRATGIPAACVGG